MQNKLNKSEQLNSTKDIYDALHKLQTVLPGQHYLIFEELKNRVAQLNSSFAEEIRLEQEEKKKAEDLQKKLASETGSLANLASELNGATPSAPA